jgi:hypothetical protein
MALTQTNHLERVVFAFRGDGDGSFKGAHIERFLVVKQDGVEIARQPGKAMTVREALADGQEWPQVLAEINQGLLQTVDNQAAQIADLQSELARVRSAVEAQLADLADDTPEEAAAKTSGLTGWFKSLFA